MTMKREAPVAKCFRPLFMSRLWTERRQLLRLALWILAIALPGAIASAGEVTYQYDDAGRLRRATYPDSSQKIYTLDAAGNRTQVQATVVSGGVLQLSAATATVSEATTPFQITVTRAGVTNGAVAVSYATANGSANAGSDYTSASGTLSWASGDSAAKSISVPITNDSSLENSETFTITLSSPTGGATLGSTTQITVTITDNDVVTFTIDNVSVNEGAGNATLTVTKSGATSLTHAVSYATVNGTASAGSDYTATSGTLSFAPADTSKTFTVAITNDSAYEGNETFSANISAPTNGATLGNVSASVTIQENDAAPSFAINDVSVSEAGSSVSFTVTKTGSTALTHVVSYATGNGSATAGSDYQSQSGTLTFASGDTSKTVIVSVLNDATYEGDETFTVSLSNPSNGAVIGRPTGTGTVVEDDPVPPRGFLQFTTSTFIPSPESITASAVVQRTGGSFGAASVVCSTANGTAVSPSDYTASSQTLTWASGDASDKFCSAAVIDDNVYERAESFSFNLSNATGAELGTSSVAILIQDNDAAPAFSINDISVAESVGLASFTVAKVGESAFSHSVSFLTSDGTAVGGADFVISGIPLEFAPGESSKAATVLIHNDTLHEGNETFTVNLSSPTNGATISDSSGTATIIDDDPQSLPPPPPTGVTAPNRTTNTSVAFSWPIVGGATSYELWNVTGAPVRVYAGAATNTTLTLSRGSVYQFYAKACNAAGCSVPSPTKQVIVDCPVTSCL